jgi:hypothetical protein
LSSHHSPRSHDNVKARDREPACVVVHHERAVELLSREADVLRAPEVDENEQSTRPRVRWARLAIARGERRHIRVAATTQFSVRLDEITADVLVAVSADGTQQAVPRSEPSVRNLAVDPAQQSGQRRVERCVGRIEFGVARARPDFASAD